MKTIKIIDLLNMISKGEEVPKKIKYKNTIYEYDFEMEDYYYRDNNYFWLMENMGKLNDEVEIIEDTPKKIEELDVELIGQCDNWLRDTQEDEVIKGTDINPYIIDTIRKNTLVFQHKLNEIIDYINKGE